MIVSSGQEFVQYWTGFRRRTRQALETVPAELLEWAPQAGKWTFGDLGRHLAAMERFMFAENVQGRPSRYPGHERALADGKDAVLALHDALHAESVAIFGALTPDQLGARCTTPAGAEITVWKWMRAMVEHEAHHRGQLYLMLGMIGHPAVPLFGLTEEEVRERSEPGG